MRRRTALRAYLHDAVVLARGGEDGLAFDDVDRDGLLQIEIAARFHGFDGGERVPVIGRRDEADVEVFLAQHFAVVRKEARALVRGLALRDDIGGAVEHVLVDIAERDDFDRRDLNQAQQIGLAVPACADQADSFGLGLGLQGDRGSGEELAAVHGLIVVQPRRLFEEFGVGDCYREFRNCELGDFPKFAVASVEAS